MLQKYFKNNRSFEANKEIIKINEILKLIPEQFKNLSHEL